jgi:hypothetical protein
MIINHNTVFKVNAQGRASIIHRLVQQKFKNFKVQAKFKNYIFVLYSVSISPKGPKFCTQGRASISYRLVEKKN